MATDDAVKQRILEAQREIENALISVKALAARLDNAEFDEALHAAARERLQAALAHLDSLRSAHAAPLPDLA